MGARAIKRFLKNNPFALLQTQAKKQLSGSNDAKAKRGGGGRPPWVYAVSLFPPAPAPLPYVVPSEVGHFSLPGPTDFMSKRELSILKRQESTAKSHKRIKSADLRVHHSLRAPAIKYPEDTLRKEFYATHPFELYRPVNVVETEESLMDDSSRNTINGESVVRRTMELIQKDGGSHPLHIAYNLALAEFYKNRAGEELAFEQAEAELERKRAESFQKQKLAGSIEKTEKYEPKEPRDVTWFKNREQDEITGNAKYIDETIAERQERRRVQEQMAQYEARNLKANNAST